MASFLITGGTGLIGSALIKRLKTSPARITVLTRDRVSANQKLGFDIRAVESLREIAASESFDYVINLAGAPIADARWSTSRKLVLWQSRVELTQKLVSWINSRDLPPKLMLTASAVGWYGDCGDTVVDERDEANSEFTHQLCDAWEKAAKPACQAGTRLVIVRLGIVIAPKGGFLEKLKLPFRLGLGARLGRGQQYLSWIHIDDVISAFMFFIKVRSDAANEGETFAGGEVFNLTSPNPISNTAFTKALANSYSRPTFLVIPAFLLQLLLGELSRLLLCGQRVLPRKLLALGFKFEYSSIEPALEQVVVNEANDQTDKRAD